MGEVYGQGLTEVYCVQDTLFKAVEYDTLIVVTETNTV